MISANPSSSTTSSSSPSGSNLNFNKVVRNPVISQEKSPSSQVRISSLGVYQSALCGAVSGVAARCVISPFDVIKIRLQLQSKETVSTTTGRGYTGIIDACKTIAKEEGLKGFWKGNWPALWLYFSYSAIQFASYSMTCDVLAKTSHQHHIGPTAQKYVAGSVAAAIATTLSYPFDLLRTRFSIQHSGPQQTYTSIRRALHTILTREGVRGLYLGLGPSLLQVVPYMGLTFGVFESLHTLPVFVAGATAGVLAKTCVYPLDTLRRHMQVQHDHAAYVLKVPRYPLHRAPAIARAMLRTHGPAAFYRGLVPALLKAAPNAAATFTVFHACQQLLLWVEARRA